MKDVKEKECFKCNKILPISDFYSHKGMLDGHLNKCISCTKNDIKTRVGELRKNEEWVENERKRCRDRYYRLGYKKKYRPSPEQKRENVRKYNQKYPEKFLASKYTEIYFNKCKGKHLHHWSYEQKSWLDVIELDIKDHNLLHRFITYDQKTMMFRSLSGEILNSKEKHLNLLAQLKLTN